MDTQAAWKIDFFDTTEPAGRICSKQESLPDPQFWSSSVREKMVDALIGLACGSRHGESIPESLVDCANMLRARMADRAVDVYDYRMTLGWIFEYWNGALPYALVCAVAGISPQVLQGVVLNNKKLSEDLKDVSRMRRRTLL